MSAPKTQLLAVFALLIAASGSLRGDDWSDALQTLRTAPVDGSGNAASARAWEVVAAADASQLPDILSAIDSATPLGANWLRAAVDTIGQRQLTNQADLPRAKLESFVRDRRHSARARELAYRWLVRFDGGAKKRLLAEMASDPSVELRREAVARLMAEADHIKRSGDRSQTVSAYRQALTAARDQDQVKQIAAKLRKLGQQVDLPRHFGFITTWKLIAPFDNSERKGFDAVFPPERELAADAKYAAKETTATWREVSTDHDFGLVDFNKPFGRLKEVVGYAWADFDSDREQQVELRLGCKNAWKLWFNGKFLFGRDEYHRGMQMDQYRFPVTLKPGRNQILLKICQNEQQEDWTEQWEFQLRVCDATGTAVLSK